MFWLWLLFQGWRDDERERHEEGKLFSAMTLAERKAYIEAQKAAQEKALESDWITLLIAVGATAGFIVLALVIGGLRA